MMVFLTRLKSLLKLDRKRMMMLTLICDPCG